MKRYIIVTFYLIISSIKLIAGPEANFNRIIKEYTLYQDGHFDFRYYKELKINTYTALNRLYGESFIVYNPDFQRIKFNVAYTKQINGTIIETPVNAFNEVLPANAANAPAYNHLKEMVVTHTGLELGATIYLDYTISTKPGYHMEIDIDEIIQEQSPVGTYTIIVNIPENKSISYAIVDSKVKPVITQKENMKQYVWTFKNIPPASRERYLPINQNGVPRLVISGYTSQEAALQRLYGQLSFSISEAGKHFFQNRIKGKDNKIDQLISIQQYIVNQISTCNLSLQETGYITRNPDEVFCTSYGTLTEKTALLASILKNMGFDPQIVVLYPGTLKKASKGLIPISDIKIMVNVDHKPLFLSAVTMSDLQLELRGNRNEVWLISDKDVRPLQVVENQGEIYYYASIQLSNQKASTFAKVRFEGGVFPITSQVNAEKYGRELAALAGKPVISEIKNFDFRHIDLQYMAEQSLSPAHNYIIYPLPVPDKGVKSWDMNILNSHRKEYLELPYPVKEVYSYEITYPSGMILKTKDSEINIRKPAGEITISIRKNGNTIKIHKALQLYHTLIPTNEYEGFRQLITTWNNSNNYLIFNIISDGI